MFAGPTIPQARPDPMRTEKLKKLILKREEIEHDPERLKRQREEEARRQRPIVTLPRTGDPRTDIALARAEAIGLTQADLTPNRIDELYQDAVQRGLVEGVKPSVMSDAEREHWRGVTIAIHKENQVKRLAAQWDAAGADPSSRVAIMAAI